MSRKADEPLIRLYNLTKDYRTQRALNDVTLTIGSGVTGLLGPNGSGKSTLIKTLLGLVKITSGSGEFLGFDLATQGRKIRERVGYMPEDDCYIAGMTGVEVVRFSACLSGLPPTEGLRRSHEILDFSGMEQERYRDIETFSTGMRQKVKFAQAIVHDPPFLIFDEPTSGLDPEERENMLARIRTLANRYGKSVLISTHILPDVQSVCDQVIILANGEVRLSESLEVLSRPASPGLTVRTAASATPLVERLRSIGKTIQQHDDSSFLIEGVDGEVTGDIWQVATETGVGILSMLPMRNSLEEVFMSAIKESRRADP